MHISDVDRYATAGASPGHRMSPKTKVAAFALVVAAIVVNANVLVLTGLGLAVAAVAVAWRLPGKTLSALVVYPAFFSAIFAWASAPDLLTGAAFVAKAVTAALAAIVLMFTTPYPQVFAPVQRVVPSIVGDAMLMTYRSFFLLAEKFQHLLTAIRLRSGLSGLHPLRSAKGTTSALGALLLYSFDLSQRTYDIMRLRGYEERLRVRTMVSATPAADAALLSGAVLLLSAAVAFRVFSAALNPYSWLAPVAGLMGLAAGFAIRSARSTR